MVQLITVNQKLDGQVRLASAANAKSASAKPDSPGFTSNQASRGRPILHYPTPDWSKVKAKTNSYNKPTTVSQNREVSSAVACCDVQMEESNPHGMGWTCWF